MVMMVTISVSVATIPTARMVAQIPKTVATAIEAKLPPLVFTLLLVKWLRSTHVPDTLALTTKAEFLPVGDKDLSTITMPMMPPIHGLPGTPVTLRSGAWFCYSKVVWLCIGYRSAGDKRDCASRNEHKNELT